MITTLLLRDKSYFELVALIDQKLHSEVLNISDCSDQTALRVFVEPECPPVGYTSPVDSYGAPVQVCLSPQLPGNNEHI